MSAAVLGEIFHCSILAGWSTLGSTGDSSPNTSYFKLHRNTDSVSKHVYMFQLEITLWILILTHSKGPIQMCGQSWK